MKAIKEIIQNIKYDNIPDGSPMIIVFPKKRFFDDDESEYKNITGNPPLKVFFGFSFVYHKSRINFETGYYYPLSKEIAVLNMNDCDFFKMNHDDKREKIPLELCIFKSNNCDISEFINKAEIKILKFNIEYSKKIAAENIKKINMVN